MSDFILHTETTAPEAVRGTLRAATQKLGFLPNALATMAESPELVEAFFAADGALQHGTLTPLEREVVAMTLARELGCEYCVAFHSQRLRDLAPELMAPLRDGLPILGAAAPRHEALRRMLRHLLSTRGQASREEMVAFLTAGFTRRQALELVLAIGTMTLSIYSNRLTRAAVDGALR